jgi:hypothetical protein
MGEFSLEALKLRSGLPLGIAPLMEWPMEGPAALFLDCDDKLAGKAMFIQRDVER